MRHGMAFVHGKVADGDPSLLVPVSSALATATPYRLSSSPPPKLHAAALEPTDEDQLLDVRRSTSLVFLSHLFRLGWEGRDKMSWHEMTRGKITRKEKRNKKKEEQRTGKDDGVGWSPAASQNADGGRLMCSSRRSSPDPIMVRIRCLRYCCIGRGVAGMRSAC
jgi:hypothetical protein